jgi:hypothetical protein
MLVPVIGYPLRLPENTTALQYVDALRPRVDSAFQTFKLRYVVTSDTIHISELTEISIHALLWDADTCASPRATISEVEACLEVVLGAIVSIMSARELVEAEAMLAEFMKSVELDVCITDPQPKLFCGLSV